VTVFLKARARADMLAIRAWGEDRWGVERTRDFLEGIIEAIERLTDFPLMGRARSAFFAGLRSIRYRGYVIFYVIEAHRPVVVAVIHERRNLAALDFADRVEGE
jgi:toxin ParE1/3/4